MRPARSIAALLLIMLLLIGCAFSPLLAQETPLEQALADASAALDAQRPVEAQQLFDAVLKQAPYLLDAHRGAARALAAQGRLGEAAQRLVAVGDGLLRAGRHADAAAAFGEAVEWIPDRAAWHALHGRAAALAQDPEVAARSLRRAVELGERSVSVRLYLAAALWDTGALDEAEALYRALIDEAPDVFAPAWQLGRLLRWRGEADEAALHLRRARDLRPQASDVATELAAASGAIDDWRKAVALAPDDRQARYGLARAAARAGRSEEAREQMKIYRDLYAAEQERTRREGIERARLDRGWELLEQGDFAAARDHFQTLTQPLGESAEVLAGLAQAYIALGDRSEAIRTLERAVRAAPDREDLRRLLDAQRTTN